MLPPPSGPKFTTELDMQKRILNYLTENHKLGLFRNRKIMWYIYTNCNSIITNATRKSRI